MTRLISLDVKIGDDIEVLTSVLEVPCCSVIQLHGQYVQKGSESIITSLWLHSRSLSHAPYGIRIRIGFRLDLLC